MIRRSGERKNPVDCNNNRGKKVWSDEEDEALKALVELHGTGNWTLISQSLVERTGKQCRERFHNHLDVGIKKGDWTEQEDRIILIMQRLLGNQWAKITKLLPGRTDNAVKNRFHATERAKLRGRLDDSMIFADMQFVQQLLAEAQRVNNEIYTLPPDVLEDMQRAQQYQYSHGQQTPLEPMEGMDDEKMEEDDDDSIDLGFTAGENLMDLDIISMDEDDPYYQLEEGTDLSTTPSMSTPTTPNRALDPGCFSFNWGCNRSSSPPKVISKPNYFCGLDGWMMPKPNQPGPPPRSLR